MDLVNDVLSCFCGPPTSDRAALAHTSLARASYRPVCEKPPAQSPPSPTLSSPETTAAEIIASLVRAEKPGDLPTSAPDGPIGATAGWMQRVAEAVLGALEDTLRSGRETWGQVLSEAYDTAVSVTADIFCDLVEYVKEHPAEIAASVLLSLVAFGVLARVIPWVLELLGFGLEGPIEGSFAAWFQSTYGGYVPKGSIMSYLQHLGATWGRK